MLWKETGSLTPSQPGLTRRAFLHAQPLPHRLLRRDAQCVFAPGVQALACDLRRQRGLGVNRWVDPKHHIARIGLLWNLADLGARIEIVVHRFVEGIGSTPL